MGTLNMDGSFVRSLDLTKEPPVSTNCILFYAFLRKSRLNSQIFCNFAIEKNRWFICKQIQFVKFLIRLVRGWRKSLLQSFRYSQGVAEWT